MKWLAWRSRIAVVSRCCLPPVCGVVVVVCAQVACSTLPSGDPGRNLVGPVVTRKYYDIPWGCRYFLEAKYKGLDVIEYLKLRPEEKRAAWAVPWKEVLTGVGVRFPSGGGASLYTPTCQLIFASTAEDHRRLKVLIEECSAQESAIEAAAWMPGPESLVDDSEKKNGPGKAPRQPTSPTNQPAP